MRAYRILLGLYPAQHRSEFGALMEQAFTDRARLSSQSAAVVEAVIDTVKSAPREHTSAWGVRLRRPETTGFIAMLVVALVGGAAPLVTEIPTALFVVPYFVILGALAFGVLRSFRHSKAAVVGLGMTAVGLTALPIVEAFPEVEAYGNSVPLVIAIELGFAGLAVLAIGIAGKSEQGRLLVTAGLLFPLCVGFVLHPIVEALPLADVELAFRAGMFGAFALLAFALACASPKQILA